MKLEKQVCSRELAEKMKELGFVQESNFYWRIHLSGGQGDIIQAETPADDDYHDYFSAYTVAELFAFSLPSTSVLKRTDATGKNPPRYYSETFDTHFEEIYSENVADSLAKLLIYQAEQGLIIPKEIKL